MVAHRRRHGGEARRWCDVTAAWCDSDGRAAARHDGDGRAASEATRRRYGRRRSRRGGRGNGGVREVGGPRAQRWREVVGR
jgi:hypothetical protein